MTITLYNWGGKAVKTKKLKNNVIVIKSDDSKSDVIDELLEVGVDREIFIDVRESFDRAGTAGIDPNLEFIWIPPFIYFPLPSFWPELGYEQSAIKTAVVNKVIRKYGILDKVTANDGQSTIVTQNLKYDAYTGQALLTKVENAFENDIYNYNVPAHFVYDGMGPAYQNINLRFNSFVGNPSGPACAAYLVDLSSQNEIFNLLQEGDEFIVSDHNTYKSKAYLICKDDDEEDIFLDIKSSPSGANYEFLIVRSGKRNLLQASIGSVTAKKDPTADRSQDIWTTSYQFPVNENDFVQVDINAGTVDSLIAASAVTMSDVWPLIYNIHDERDSLSFDCVNFDDNSNSYERGERGIWRLYESYSFVSPNTKPDIPAVYGTEKNITLAHDGVVMAAPLFDWSQPLFNKCDETSAWLLTSKTTQVSENGQSSESKNILGQYSAALFGYNENVPIAVGNNLRNYEFGFEGFEVVPEDSVTVFNLNNLDYLEDSGHLNFSCVNWESKITETYDVVGLNSSNYIIDLPYSSIMEIPETADLVVDLGNGDKAVYPLTNIAFTEYNAAGSSIQNPSADKICQVQASSVATVPSNQYKMELVLHYCNTLPSYDCAIDFAVYDLSLVYNFIEIECNIQLAILDELGAQILLSQITSNNDLIVFFNDNEEYFSNYLLDDESQSLYMQESSIQDNFYNLHFYQGCPGGAEAAISLSITTEGRAQITTLAHTGKKSLGILAGSHAVPQTELNLHPGKDYIVSGWVHQPGANPITGFEANQPSIKVETFASLVPLPSAPSDYELVFHTFKPEGEIIDGWQRIEGRFSYYGRVPDASLWNSSIRLILDSGNANPVDNGNLFNAYFDDIRIYPADGNMESYVYDTKMRVTEKLDNNNYFTRYKYDSAGSLISVQKETEKGVRTIQESGAYMKASLD